MEKLGTLKKANFDQKDIKETYKPNFRRWVAAMGLAAGLTLTALTTTGCGNLVQPTVTPTPAPAPVTPAQETPAPVTPAQEIPETPAQQPSYNYPEPTTVTLGAENSGYTVYKAVGDFNIWEQTRPDSRMARSANVLPTEAEAAEHYFNEYENTVNDAVADIEANLVNYNQATQDYLQPWLNNIKAQNGKYDRQHIDQTLEVIYNGSSFLFTDLIKNTPLVSDNINGKKVNRYVLCYSIEAICNEQYDKGYGFNNNQMDARYTNKKNDAISKLDGRSGLSEEDLGVDIDYHNCAQVVNILNQKLSTALNYLNQTKGTNIDLSFMKQAINLASSTQPVTAIRDHLKGNIKNYALDNNMKEAIDYVNTQTQENGMEL